MLRCYSLHVSTDGVNGHTKCLLSALSDLFNCVISFIFSEHLNTMCSSRDALENGNVEPETIEMRNRDYQRREPSFMQEGT